MWLVLLITGISIGIYITIKTILDYLDYEVVTSIKVINEIPTEFPAVTFYILRNSRVNISFKDLNFSCVYNQVSDCTKNINTKQDKLGFISYTFKSQKAYLSSTKFGLKIGLNLTNIPIDFNQPSNIQDGVRVIIHNQTSDPEYYLGDSNNGFNLAPGLVYEISVKRIFTYKLGQPYNNCLKDVKSIDSFDSDLYRFMINSTNYSYRQKDCLKYCMTTLLYKALNITEYKLDRWENIIGKHPEYLSKTLEIYQDLIRKGLNEYDVCKDCPVECDSVNYETLNSFTKFIQQTEKTDKNVIYFTVYYENLDYTVIDQVAKMTELDLISNIGGNLGLFIGISFLSFAELIELLIEIIYILY